MKYKVIKEFSGIEVGTEIELIDNSQIQYMTENGYIELIIEPIKGKVEQSDYQKKVEPTKRLKK